MAAGDELAYEAINATFTSTSTSATGANVTGLAITVDVGSKPIEIIVQGTNFSGSNVFGVAVLLNQDGTNIGGMASVGQNLVVPLNASMRLNPASGSHTYQIKMLQLGSGTMTITAGNGSGQNPANAYVTAVER